MGTTLDKPLYYVNSTHILACTGLHFYVTFIHSLRARQLVFTLGICMYEGADQDSGYEHEESYLMHDMKYFIYDCIFCMECGLMYVCHFLCISMGMECGLMYVCHCMCI